MDINEALAATQPAPGTQYRRPTHSAGREYEWDGDVGWYQTEPLTERPRTWDEFIRDAGLDPDEVEVVEPVQVRGWDMPQRLEDGTTGLVRAHYYRLTMRRRVLATNIDALIKAAKRCRCFV